MAAPTVSVFGKPITKGSREERAEAAAQLRTAGGKLDQVLQAALESEKSAAEEVNTGGGNYIRSFGTNSDDVNYNTYGSFDDHVGVNSGGGNYPRCGGVMNSAVGNYNTSGFFDFVGLRSYGGNYQKNGGSRSSGHAGHHSRQSVERKPSTFTNCFIYNATGDPITFVLTHDWQGHVAGRCPKIIQNGQWAYLKHVCTLDPNAKGSIAAAVYNIQNYADAMFCWSNPKKTPAFGKNTVYCQMNDPGYFNYDVDWNEMYHNVRDSGSQYEGYMEGFTTKVYMDEHGSTPRYFAEFYLDA